MWELLKSGLGWGHFMNAGNVVCWCREDGFIHNTDILIKIQLCEHSLQVSRQGTALASFPALGMQLGQMEEG